MSLKITPYPTASYMDLAMQNPGSIKIDAQYIGVGEGLQDVEGTLDEGGRATINTLQKPVAWLPILTAKQISRHQHQLVVDFSDVLDRDWNFSECCLADPDKNVIAIYGNKSQALQTVSTGVDVALVAINMTLATLPADSINIIHQGVALELFMSRELLEMDAAIGSFTLGQMRAYNARRELELAEAARRAAWEQGQQEQFATHQNAMQRLMTELRDLVSLNRDDQMVFNHETELSVGSLSLALIK